MRRPATYIVTYSKTIVRDATVKLPAPPDEMDPTDVRAAIESQAADGGEYVGFRNFVITDFKEA